MSGKQNPSNSDVAQMVASVYIKWPPISPYLVHFLSFCFLPLSSLSISLSKAFICFRRTLYAWEHNTMKENVGNPLHLKSVNHISLICTSVKESINFYQNLLGFFPIRRPGSFDFDGAW